MSNERVGYVSGHIMMFGGSMIPNGWVLCDGQNGTPDMRNKFKLKNVEQSHIATMKSMYNEEEVEISEREYDDDEDQPNDASPIYSMVYIMKS